MTKSMKKYISRRISFFLAVLFLAVNVYSATARAATPEIKVQNTTSLTGNGVVGDDGFVSITDMQIKTIVAHLKITNLNVPEYGQRLDNRATVLSYDGYFWEIPVIWVDETGTVSYVCLPGKNYRPVFAYYIPKNVVVANDAGSDSYTIELPQFLDGIISDSNVLMVGSEAYGITFITTGDLADALTSLDVTKPISSLLVSNDDIKNFFEVGQKKIIKSITDELVPIDPETPEQEANTTQESTKQDSANQSENEKPVKDYVSIHCTQNAIDNIGADKLQLLLDLIINVIEPQAVYQLNSGFSSYASACRENLLGDEIGLYVYDSEFDKGANDLDSAVAYVMAQYQDEAVSDFGYYMGVNVKSLYSKDEESGTYNLDATELVNLNNTLVHELMHAYMYDYDRTGMMGVVQVGSEITAAENAFPTWFIEGIATCVENAYTYHGDVFDAMMDQELNTFTNDSLYEYYTTYDDEDSGHASIDSTNKYYDSATNEASAYVGGYLAVMYLANIANDYYDSGTDLINYYDNGTFYYESKAIRLGLDYILEELHDGVSLDSIINEVSQGKYTSTQDFQDTFLTKDSEGNYDESYDFCRGLLNYLNFATGVVSKDNPDARANGSILLPFDTARTSVIEGSLPEGIGTQEVFVINDEMTFVSSTVDNETALESAGVKADGKSDENENEIIDEEFVQVAKPDNSTSDQVKEVSEEPQKNEEAESAEEAAQAESYVEDKENEETSDDTKSVEKTSEEADSEDKATENTTTEEKATEDTTTEESATENTATDETTTEETTTEDTAIKEITDEDASADASETAQNDDIVEDIVDDLENTTYLIDEASDTENGASEEKDIILLPSLIDTTTKATESIEKPGTADTALEALSEAIAPPAPSSSDDNSESDENDDTGGDGDGSGDSDVPSTDESIEAVNNVEA